LVKTLTVRQRPGNKLQGQLIADGRIMRCALGRSGIGTKIREGDGKTPRGTFRLLNAYFRTDKFRHATSGLPLTPITGSDGWCDAVEDRNYNRPVKLPYPASHETLMRNDHLYDVFIVLDFNIRQHMRRGGSAIFFHLAKEDYAPTEGCVAISRPDMDWLLPRIRPDTVMKIL